MMHPNLLKPSPGTRHPWAHGLAFAWLSWGIAACGSFPQAPTTPRDDPNFATPDIEPAPGIPPEEDPPQPFRLRPADVVTLQTVSGETTAYPGLVVSETGHLHVPLAGDVDVLGLTLTEAEGRLQQALRRYDRYVVVNLFVTTPAGHQATVVGAVAEPGRFTVGPDTRLADLLAMARGPQNNPGETSEPTQLADLDGARLVRERRVVPVSVSLAQRGHPRHNVRVRAGDHLYVPPSLGRRISVLGHVGSPTTVPFRAGLRLTEALAIAGGVNTAGDRGDIRVVRGPLRSPRVYAASLASLIEGDATDVVLAPGDVVYVAQDPLSSLGEVLGHLGPILAAGTTFGVTYYITTQ